MNSGNKKELQIEIDDVYSCTGSCPGCMLTVEERMSKKPDMDEPTMDLTLEKLSDYITGLQDSRGIESVNLTFGIGDHLRMSDEYLASLTYKTERFFRETKGMPQSRAMHVTMSLIDRPQHVERSLRILKANKGVDVVPIVVIDPILLFSQKRFAPDYLLNIRKAKEIFSVIDMQVNISDSVVDTIHSSEIADFAKENEFSEVTINWVPNNFNLGKTTRQINRTKEWLLELAATIDSEENLSSSYIPVVEKCVNSQKNSEELEIFDYISKITEETYRYSIQIDEKGRVFPKMEAIGDIPFNPRFGFSELCNIHQHDMEESVEAGVSAIEKWLKKSILKQPCIDCPYQKACCSGGYQAYSQFLDQKNGCKNPSYYLFKSAV